MKAGKTYVPGCTYAIHSPGQGKALRRESEGYNSMSSVGCPSVLLQIQVGAAKYLRKTKALTGILTLGGGVVRGLSQGKVFHDAGGNKVFQPLGFVSMAACVSTVER